MKKTRIIFVVLSLLALLAIIFIYPVRTTSTRLAIILLALFPYAYLHIILWRKHHVGKVLLGLSAVILIWALSSYQLKQINPSHFIKHLQSFEDTKYVWGGETAWGIDCSGLIRQAMVHSYLSSGRIGSAFQVWFFDCPAKNFAVQYKDLFAAVVDSGTINTLDHSLLKPGAIAVTKSGLHILAYLGNEQWIQASPNDKKVISKHHLAEDLWFLEYVEIYQLKSDVVK